MSNFVETQANKFGEAMNEAVANKLINVIDPIVNLSQCIIDDNNKYLKEHEELIASLNKMNQEDKDEIKPRVVEHKGIYDKFQYAFDKLLSTGKTLLHDVDAHGNLKVKIYSLESELDLKLTSTYKVELK